MDQASPLNTNISALPSPSKSPTKCWSEGRICQPGILPSYRVDIESALPVEASMPRYGIDHALPLNTKRSAFLSPLKSPTKNWSVGRICQFGRFASYRLTSESPVPWDCNIPRYGMDQSPPLNTKTSSSPSPLKSPTKN